MEPKNRFQDINSASLCSLAGRYNKPIPTQCLAPIDFLNIPAQDCKFLISIVRTVKKNTTVYGTTYIERRKLFTVQKQLQICTIYISYISRKTNIYFRLPLMTKWFVPNLEYVFAEFAVLCVFLSLLFK